MTEKLDTRRDTGPTLPAQYQPGEVEQERYERWVAAGYFRASAALRAEGRVDERADAFELGKVCVDRHGTGTGRVREAPGYRQFHVGVPAVGPAHQLHGDRLVSERLAGAEPGLARISSAPDALPS